MLRSMLVDSQYLHKCKAQAFAGSRSTEHLCYSSRKQMYGTAALFASVSFPCVASNSVEHYNITELASALMVIVVDLVVASPLCCKSVCHQRFAQMVLSLPLGVAVDK